MNLPKFAVKNPVATIMLMLLVLIMGFVSFTNLSLDLIPNMNPPVVAVMTTYPGSAPQEIEEMVTKPIEEVVAASQGLKTMQSQSSSNVSLVIAQFDWGTDMSEVREDLSGKLERLSLGEEIEKPVLLKFDPTMMPVIQFAIANGANLSAIQDKVDNDLVPQLQNIDGVASVDVQGGFEEEIIVDLNQEQLKKYNLTQDKITQLIQGNNLTYPGGMLEDGEKKLNLRILGKVDSLENLRQLPVSIIPQADAMKIVTLDDVAEIKPAQKEVDSLIRSNGSQSLMVSIQKEGTANTAEVSQKVRDKVAQIEEENPAWDFVISSDQGEIIEKSVANVGSSLLYGALFAILVILLFLRSAGSTLIVALAIPFSVIATFVMMYFSGISLNIMSLGGLALGVGMLVDNAIVVIENIHRHLILGKTRTEAAISGAYEVAGAITSSTLTTIAVFLPVVFIGGFVGELFRELAMTVTFSLTGSLLVALTVIPALSAILMKAEKTAPPKENRIYKNIITWALNNRVTTVGLVLLVFLSSFVLIPKIGTEFMPSQDEGMFNIELKLPEGTALDKTAQSVREVEEAALDVAEVEVVTASIGNGNMFGSSSAEQNRASLTVGLSAQQERSRSTKEVMDELETTLNNLSLTKNMELNFKETNSMESMSGTPSTVEVMISGKDPDLLQEYADNLTSRMDDIKEIDEAANSLEVSRPEFQFIVDKEKAFQNGLTSFQIASFINNSLNGDVATKISSNGQEEDVRVKVAGLQNSKEAIENLTISSPSGQNIALKELGTVTEGEGPVTIVRENQQEVVTLNLSYSGTDLGTVSNKVQTEIDQMIDDLDIKEDLYSVKISGTSEMMDEAFSDLLMVMVLAIIFVYMIMASLFGSFIYPLIILVTLPLSLIGVAGGLFAAGHAFGITAFIGIIILAGIVVNNAIVFIDYTNKLITRGLAVREALIEAGLTRFRPIMMTALTTILGLMPLAVGLGEGTEIQAPMAVAVIGGLLSSTLLTLVVIPVVFSLIETFRGLRKKMRFIMDKLDEFENEEDDKQVVTAK